MYVCKDTLKLWARGHDGHGPQVTVGQVTEPAQNSGELGLLLCYIIIFCQEEEEHMRLKVKVYITIVQISNIACRHGGLNIYKIILVPSLEQKLYVYDDSLINASDHHS